METNLANIKKPAYWLELPGEVIKGVGTEVLRLFKLENPMPVDMEQLNRHIDEA